MSRYKLIKRNDIYKLVDANCQSDLRYSVAQSLLYDFYCYGLHADTIQPIIDQLRDDLYFYLIEEVYKNNSVLDWIAEDRLADVTTIKRNKKRLTLIIYTLWEEVKRNE